MNLQIELLEIAKLLLSEDSAERTAEILLNRVLQATRAERGFIVVREGEVFVQKVDVHFSRQHRSKEAHRFSRSLVRQAIDTGQILESSDVLLDPRFADAESVQQMGRCAVLVAPLRSGGEVYGVVYLESRSRPEGFDAQTRQFLDQFTEIAGLSLRKALEHDALERRSRSLERDLFARHDFRGIVTQHPKMLELLQVVAQVADSDTTILIRGETGTGKELIAQAVHCNSERRNKPLVTLHCTALPDTIFEGELFGHVRGAFTGADRDRAGRIAAANGGTLFLDEIAEIPRKLQAKLLRFLQFGEIQRLGSDRVEKVDVRVLAATHHDLRALVQTKRFREDLYFRLNVMELRIPPLRERKSDIPLLLEHFVRKHWRRPGEQPVWTARAEQVLRTYSYPGNVRELGHLVERACLLARGPEMDVDLLPEELMAAAPDVGEDFTDLSKEELQAATDAAVAKVERKFLQALMKRCEGNISRAARTSGLHRSRLQRLLAAHGLGSEPAGGKREPPA